MSATVAFPSLLWTKPDLLFALCEGLRKHSWQSAWPDIFSETQRCLYDTASKMFHIQYWKEKLSHIFLFFPSLVLTRLFSLNNKKKVSATCFLWTDDWLHLGFRVYDLSSESCKLKSCFVKLLFRLLSNTRSCIDHSTTHLRGNET